MLFADSKIKIEPDYAPSFIPTNSGNNYWSNPIKLANSMMTSMSPIEPSNGHRPSIGGGYVSGHSDGSKSPLSMSLGFLKTLTEKKNTRGVSPKSVGSSVQADTA